MDQALSQLANTIQDVNERKSFEEDMKYYKRLYDRYLKIFFDLIHFF